MNEKKQIQRTKEIEKWNNDKQNNHGNNKARNT